MSERSPTAPSTPHQPDSNRQSTKWWWSPLSSTAPRFAPAPFGPALRSALRPALAAAICAALLTACTTGSPPSSDASTSPTGGSSTSPSTSGATTSPGTTSPSASTTPAATPTTPAGRQLAVTVTGRTITPSPAQVDLGVGETLTLIVTVNHDDLVHVHGFEIEKTLKAGTPTAIVLTGSEPGVYEVETHEPALTLLTIAVR